MPGGNGFSRAFAVTTENEETKMTDIIIQGIGGRMGHVLCEMIAQREDCRVVAGIDMKDGEMNGIPVYDSLDKLELGQQKLENNLHTIGYVLLWFIVPLMLVLGVDILVIKRREKKNKSD